jgi:signal transduction histidine kinase
MTATTLAAVPDEWSTAFSPARALAVTARVVNSSLQLDDVLRTVVRLACDVLEADRATILLLDEQQCLAPAASVGRVDDPDGLARFRAMSPVQLASIPHAFEALSKAQAVPVPDVAASPLVPSEWRDAFGLTSLLLAPIVTHGEILGALVVDYASARDGFAATEILTLEGIAACTSTAIRNARMYDDVTRRAQSLDLSLDITAELNAAMTTRAVCEVALDGLMRLLDGQAASLHLVKEGEVVTLAARGACHPAPGTYLIPLGQPGSTAWRADEPTDVAAELRALPAFSTLPEALPTLVLPLTEPPPPGFAVITCRREPSREVWRVARSVAGQVMLALDRARLTEETHHRLEHLETSYRLATELAGAADLDAVVAQLAPSVRSATGCELIDILLAPTRGSERFASSATNTSVSELMGQWVRQPPRQPVDHEGLLVVPMLLDSELVGVMRLRAHDARLGPAEEGFLLAGASAVASLVTRAGLSSQVGAAQRELAIVQERERIARDLHDTLGQSLFTLDLQLADCVAATTESETRKRAETARETTRAAALQLRQAIHALAFLRTKPSSLRASLRELVAELSPELNVRLTRHGRCFPLPPTVVEALTRVAREGLVNVERHARATDVVINIRYEPGQVGLLVTDNGTGLAQRSSSADGGLHFGLRSMQRRLEEVGGSLTFENVAPHGLRLVATVPV